MDNSVRSINDIPYPLFVNQIATRNWYFYPKNDYNSLKELENAVTQDGKKFAWHIHETTALHLRANNQHFGFPAQCTELQKKVFEQFRVQTRFFAVNAYKLIRSEIFRLTFELFSNQSIYTEESDTGIKLLSGDDMRIRVSTMLARFFFALDSYWASYEKSDDREKRMNIVKESLAGLQTHMHSFKEMSSNSPLYKKFNEFQNLINFFSDCFKNYDVSLPYLLIPSCSYNINSFDAETLMKLYLDSGKGFTNGIKLFCARLDGLVNELFVEKINKTERSQKKLRKQKVKKFDGKDKNLSAIQEFVDKNKKRFNELNEKFAGLVTREQAEMWTAYMADRGLIKLNDRSKIRRIDETHLFKLMNNLQERIVDIVSKQMMCLYEYNCESVKLKSTINDKEKQNTLKNILLPDLDAISHAFVGETFNYFQNITLNAISTAKEIDCVRKDWLEQIKSFCIVSKSNIYPSHLVKPLDCMFHETMNSIMELERVIPSTNELQINILNEALNCLRIIFKRINEFNEMLNPNQIEYVNDPSACSICLEDIIIRILSVKQELNKFAKECLQDSNEDFIKKKIERELSFLDMLIRLFIEFLKTENRGVLLPIIMKLKESKDPLIGDQEMEKKFEQECLNISVWMLKKIQIAENLEAIKSAKGHVEDFNKLIQDDSYSDLVKEVADVKLFKADKMLEYYSELEQFFIRMQDLQVEVIQFHEELKGRWIESDKQRYNQLIETLAQNLAVWPEESTFKENVLKLIKIVENKDNKESNKSFWDKSENLLGKYIYRTNELKKEQLEILRSVQLVVNRSFIEAEKAKKILLDLEGDKNPSSSRRKTPPKATIAYADVPVDSDSVEPEADTQEIASELEITPPTETLKMKKIHPAMARVILLRSMLRGLFVDFDKTGNARLGKEQVVNALHYTAHIAELLDQYADQDNWDETALLVFLSKSTLLLEQTMKYRLVQFCGSWSEEEKKILSSHDLTELWQKYQACANDPTLVINRDDQNLLIEFSSMAAKTSRYPLQPGSSELIKPLVNSITVHTEHLIQDQQTNQARLSPGRFNKSIGKQGWI